MSQENVEIVRRGNALSAAAGVAEQAIRRG
jgi:hypothetical protein